MCVKTLEAETSAYEAAWDDDWESWTTEEAVEGSETGEETAE
jgi:hypothetical protein